MELAVFLPTLLLAVAFAASVLLYSVQKVFGPGVLSFRNKAQVGSDGGGTPSHGAAGDTPRQDVKEVTVPIPKSAVLDQLSLGLTVASYQWSNLTLTVRDKMTGQLKKLLHGCTGTALSGDLVALMGPSGAGKSSMLDCLCMRSTGGQVAGIIRVNGRSINKARFRSISTYVPQEDNFVPTLSVWETLAFTTDLRLPESFSKADKEVLMNEALTNMGLQKVKHSQVGGMLPGGLSVRGISGGERRRLSIGCGVVGAPRIIALDEPTSGLDSNAALVVMECMKRLAEQGRIIISSIHQPRAAIWDLFTKVQVLSEGRSLYFGPIHEVTAWYTEKLNYEYDPLVHGNTAEWLSDLVSISFDEPPKYFKRSMRCIKDVEAAAARFAKEHPEAGLITGDAFKVKAVVHGSSEAVVIKLSDAQAAVTQEEPLNAVEEACRRPHARHSSEVLHHHPSTEKNLSPSEDLSDSRPTIPSQDLESQDLEPQTLEELESHLPTAFRRNHPTHFWNQYCVLQRRALQAYTRNPLNVAGRTMMAIFIGILGGLVFMKDVHGEEGIRQAFNAIFFITLVLALVPFTYMSMFVSDRSFFMRDPARSLYSTAAYYLSIMTVNAAVTIINAAFLVLLMYGMIGLRDTDRAVLASAAVACMHSLVAVQALVLCAFITPNQDLAFVLAVSYDVLSSLLAGVWVHIGNLIAFLRWVSYASFFRYTINAFISLQYAARDDGCGVMPVITQQQRQAAAAAAQHGSPAPHFPTGRESCDNILTSQDMQLSMGGCIGGLAVLLVVLHVASYVALARQTKRS